MDADLKADCGWGAAVESGLDIEECHLGTWRGNTTLSLWWQLVMSSSREIIQT